MDPLVGFYLLLMLTVLPLGWIKGGPPERLGATILLVSWWLSYLLQDVTVGKTFAGEAAIDAVTLLAFLWLAMTRRRWWLLAVTAVMILLMAVHAASALLPELTQRGDRVARMGLGVLLPLSLLAGVGERWLAGERPGSRTRQTAS